MSDPANTGGPPDAASPGQVDWEALEQQAGSDAEREWLQFAQALEEVAAEVRPAMQNGAPPDGGTTVPLTTSEPEEGGRAIGSWGKYILREKVGEGGFGAVFRAWDPLLEHEVAIKMLHRRVSDARLRDALLVEGRALARIDHVNVVRVLGMEAQDDQLALCMEFVHGDTLEDIVRRQGTLNVGEAVLIGEAVCRALAAVHNAGFVHRDVKARNVMRQQAGRIVLMDFGAGRHSRDLQVPGRTSNIGTPPYMAPELLLAGESAGEASDVYSVGVLLYFLVTASYPVEGQNLEGIKRAHLQGRRTPLLQRRPDLPTWFAKTVERALSPDPAHRFQNAGALLSALLTGGPTPPSLFAASSLQRAAAVPVVAIVGAGVLGAIINRSFNVTMERIPPFGDESAVAVLQWGFKSLVAPLFYVGVMLLLCWAVREVTRLVRIPRSLTGLTSRIWPKTPVGVAYLAVALGIAGLCTTVWYFRELLGACTTAGLVNSSRDKLAQVEPGHVGPFFRLSSYVLMTIFVLALLHLRSAGKGPGTPDPERARLALFGMLALTLVLSAAPYRMLWGNTVERFDIAGERCYPLGASQSELQLFCPDREPPRTRIVEATNPDLHRTGIVESLFTAVSHKH